MARSSSCGAPSTRARRLRPPAPGEAGLHGRRGVLPRADRRGPRARGAPHPAADHRRRRRRGRRTGRPRSSASSSRRPIRTTTKEAELAKLFTNTWRYMKFAVANQFFMIAAPGRRRLHQRPARHPRGLPARRRPAGSGLRRRARACSRTRCSSRPSRATTSRWARPRCRSTRACRRTSCPRSSAVTAACRARPSASSAWHSRPSRTTRARRSATSCASCSAGPARGCWRPTRTSRTSGS